MSRLMTIITVRTVFLKTDRVVSLVGEAGERAGRKNAVNGRAARRWRIGRRG